MDKESLQGFQLSPQQRHLWLMQQAGGRNAYRAQCAVLIEGDVDIKILEAALRELSLRHEILRSTFRRLPWMRVPLQVVGDNGVAWALERDLSGLRQEEQERELETLFQEAGPAAFDFERGPLLHAVSAVLSQGKRALYITLPAMLADALTLNNIASELGELYTAILRGERLVAPPLQYADVSAVLNDLLVSEETELGREYWSKEITEPVISTLPFEKRVRTQDGFSPKFSRATIGPDVGARIDALAGRYGVTGDIFFLACWYVLLWRITQVSEVTVGPAYSGRSYEGLDEMFGLFAKYLPIRCELEGAATFARLLRQVSGLTREASQWQDYFSWDHVFEPDGPGSTLEFCSFVYDFEEEAKPYRAQGVTFSIYGRRACIDRFKLRLCCARREGSITAEMHYDTGLFLHEDIERLAREFEVLVESAVSRPEAPIGELPILSPPERKQLLFELNDTGDASLDSNDSNCIHRLFEEQVARTPDKSAVVYEAEKLTFAELNARSNQLARYLARRGVGPETRVAICLDRSLEMVVGLLGILKSGAAYVPLDPSYPGGRLAFVLKDARVCALLTAQHLSRQIDHPPPLICLDSDWETISCEEGENFESSVQPDNLAYVIYTSGSTGRPKGVMISHRAICNRLLWMQKYFPLTAADRVLQKTPFSFDASVWEFYVPLIAGAELIMARPGGHQESDYLVKAVAEHEATILQAVPSMLRVLLDDPAFEKCASLRRVFCGGEAFPTRLKEDFFARMDAKLVNLYGPTEASIDATFLECERADKAWADLANIPIGRPLANVQVYVLDEYMGPVPVGVRGELYISGAGLARGYMDRPDLTAEKFLPNRFSERPGERLYRTGDQARHLAGGIVEFLGRADHQVKLRGFRIELGEIESALDRSPSVKKAVVLAREDAPGEKRLVAYVIPEIRGEHLASELQSFLKERLPDYMIPSAFVILDAFPLSLNGKLNRQKLPPPERAYGESEQAFIAPRTPIEEQVARIWAEVLNLPVVGIHNTFFDLGGHSLLATEVVSRMRNDFQVDLTIRTVLESPTVAELASMISEGRLAKTGPGASDAIPRRSRSMEEQVEELDRPSSPDFEGGLNLEPGESRRQK
ncbi:MAG TPA: amino acid adenylation domain-containing protein [Blastocatellia bacterium]|nr:amino acid adenylation domain-containing protein [Blastocatellia bacterium]